MNTDTARKHANSVQRAEGVLVWHMFTTNLP